MRPETKLSFLQATEDPEVIYNVPSLPPALKGIKLIRRDQKTSESPNRSTRLSSHSRLLTNLGSSDELSEGVSGEVSGTEGRTAAAGLATWPWFSFLTPERDASRDRTPPAGSGVNRPGEGASLNAVGSGGNDIPGPDNDIIGMKGGVGQMGADVRGKSVGGRRLGGSSRQAIASIMRTMETALSGESEASHEEGPANRSLHGRDLSGIRRPQQCPAFRPDHFRRLAGLPEPQTLPTPDAPFLFLHNRKCGGSTLRHLVQESAAARQLTSYIPCFEPVACETYDLANMTTAVGGDVSVVAGHFSWDAVEELSGAAEMS